MNMTTLEATQFADTIKTAPLSRLAALIRKDWGAKVNYAAKPYLEAMSDLDSIDGQYGSDSGKSIVLYFLSNASTYRGETAKLIKAELKRRAGIK